MVSKILHYIEFIILITFPIISQGITWFHHSTTVHIEFTADFPFTLSQVHDIATELIPSLTDSAIHKIEIHPHFFQTSKSTYRHQLGYARYRKSKSAGNPPNPIITTLSHKHHQILSTRISCIMKPLNSPIINISPIRPKKSPLLENHHVRILIIINILAVLLENRNLLENIRIWVLFSSILRVSCRNQIVCKYPSNSVRIARKKRVWKKVSRGMPRSGWIAQVPRHHPFEKGGRHTWGDGQDK